MTMNDQLVKQLTNLRMFKSALTSQRHKPILVALLLRNFIRDGSTSAAFVEVEEEANDLIARFAPSRSGPRAQYPFWRLQADGFWEIDGADKLELNRSGDPRVLDLRDPIHRGRWTPDALAELERYGGERYLRTVLDRYFPDDGDEFLGVLGV